MKKLHLLNTINIAWQINSQYGKFKKHGLDGCKGFDTLSKKYIYRPQAIYVVLNTNYN